MKLIYALILLICSIVSIGQNNFSFLQKKYSYYSNQYNFDSANYYLDQQAKLSLNKEELGLYFLNKGDYFLDVLNLDSSKFYLEKAVSSQIHEARKHETMLYLAKVFVKEGNIQKGIEKYKQAYDFSKEFADSLQIQSLLSLASVYVDESSLDSAKTYVKYLKSKLDSNNKNHDLASYYDIQSVIAFRDGNYDMCIDYVDKRGRVSKSIGDKKGEIGAHAKIGALLIMLERHNEAIRYLEEASIMARDSKSSQLWLDIQLNLAGAYYYKKEFSKALDGYLALIPVLSDQKLGLELANLYSNIAACYIDLGSTKEGISYLKKGISKAIQNGDTNLLASQKHSLGIYYIKTKKPYLAIKSFKESLTLDPSNLDLQSKNYNALSRAYKLEGDYRMAHESLVLHKQLSDSLFDLHSSQQISDIETKYRVALKEEENKKLQAEVSKQKVVKQRDYILKWGLVLLSLFLVGLLYFVYNTNKIKIQQQKEKLAYRLKTLEELKERVKQKNNIVKHLESEIKAHHNTEDFANELLRKISTENDWGKFITQFNLLHPGFVDTLTSKYQKITPNDVRISTLVKLQLTEKEMAELLCVVPDAVKKAKSRLKKKLSLGKGEPLFEYLNSLN